MWSIYHENHVLEGLLNAYGSIDYIIMLLVQYILILVGAHVCAMCTVTLSIYCTYTYCRYLMGQPPASSWISDQPLLIGEQLSPLNQTVESVSGPLSKMPLEKTYPRYLCL